MSARWNLALLGLLTACGAQAQAQAPADARAPAGTPASAHLHHEHPPLNLDAALTWNALLEHTVENFPRFVELEARDREAQAWDRRAHSPWSGQPSMTLSYRSDESLSNFNLREYEAGLVLPLWRAGQRRAAVDVGSTAGEEARAAAAALRWDVAGRLREALWDLESASNGLELARDELERHTEARARRHAP